MNKKLSALILTVSLLLSTLAGCATNEAAGPADEPNLNADGRKVINFWFWGAAPDHQVHMKKTLVDPYNASQEEYFLNLEFRNTVDKDVPVALAANAGPDIVYASGPAATSIYAQEKKIISLNSYAEQYDWKDRLLGVLYDSCSIGGELYSLPNSISMGGVFYNKALLAEKGWEVPKTIEDLEKIMDLAMAEGMYGSAAGNKGWRPCNDNFSSLMVNHFVTPTNLYECLSGQKKFNNPEMLAAITKSKEWYSKGYLSGDDYTNLESQEAIQMLADKRTPFVLAPSLYYQFVDQSFKGELANDVGFVPMPALYTDKPVYDVSIPCNFSISATTPYADECAKILDRMMTPEFMVEMTKGWPGYWLVPLANIDKVDTSTLEGLAKSSVEALEAAAPAIAAGQFGFHPTTFFPPQAQEKWRDIDMVWQGVATPEEFLDSVDSVVGDEIANGLVCPLTKPTV